MAYKMTKRGSLDNEITYEFLCDTIEDMNAIEDRYKGIGSIAIVLQGSGGIEVYISGSNRQWIPLSAISSGSGSGSSGNVKIDLSNYATKASPEFTGSISLGRKDDSDIGTNSVAEGSDVVASGNYSHAEGFQAQATGHYCHAEGAYTLASNYSHAEGWTTEASGENSHAEGCDSVASGDYSHAEGYETEAGELYSHAEGYDSHATGEYTSHAEGYGTVASGNYGSHAEGSGTVAEGYSSHAEGDYTYAEGDYSHAEGYETYAYGDYGSHSEGDYTFADGYASHAEGYYTHAEGECSHAEGYDTIAEGDYSHAEGVSTEANGSHGSHAEGRSTKAQGDGSHAEGEYTIAAGANSHVSGMYNIEDSYANWPEWVSGTAYVAGDKVKVTSTIDNKTVITGYECKNANSNIQFISSNWTDLLGQMNYAEIVGNGTVFNSSNARALDWSGNEYLKGDLYVNCNADSTGGTKVAVSDDPVFTGSISLNRKAGTTAGTESIAVGNETAANGPQTVAFGRSTISNGDASFTCGSGLVATGGSEFVIGTYNKLPAEPWQPNTSYVMDDYVVYHDKLYYCASPHTSAATFEEDNGWYHARKYLLTIGNGNNSSGRGNAFVVDIWGNAHLLGDLYVGCSDDSQGGTKLAHIPDPPTTDGTYTLQATVASGVVTYTWIAGA